jgi:hypothetical protein
MKKVIGLMVVGLMMVSCSKDDVNDDCFCQDQWKNYYSSNCNDDGKEITTSNTFNTVGEDGMETYTVYSTKEIKCVDR